MITLEQYIEIATFLKVELAALKAVEEVESTGEGFLESGKIKILFEGHRFFRYAKNAKEIAKKYPKICYPKWTKQFYYGGDREYLRFNVAFGLDAEAAMKSTSWGAFQIMGDEFWRLGFETVGQMVDSFKKGEYEQLQGFAKFVVSKNLVKALQQKQWAVFARGYNGSNFKQNQYDTKLQKAYEKYAKIFPPDKYPIAVAA